MNLLQRAAISGTRRLKRAIYRQRARWNLLPARPLMPATEYEKIQSICAFLGPYRNLTTLTAAVLGLHPQCQVLNHGGFRVLTETQLNIFRDPSDETFRRFSQHVVDGSQATGGDDDGGGSIVHSHSFRNAEVRAAYEKQFGKGPPRNDVRSLVWKESLSLSNYLRDQQVDLDRLLAANQKLRFLMPIRNPLDCAVSNCKTGHARRFRGQRTHSVPEVLSAVMAEIADFYHHIDRHPTRFLTFYQYEMNAELMQRLAAFLGVEPYPDWVADAVGICNLRPAYSHDPQLRSQFRRLVDEHFANQPATASKLSRFLDS